MRKTWREAHEFAVDKAALEGASYAVCADQDSFTVTYLHWAEMSRPEDICEVVTPLDAARELHLIAA